MTEDHRERKSSIPLEYLLEMKIFVRDQYLNKKKVTLRVLQKWFHDVKQCKVHHTTIANALRKMGFHRAKRMGYYEFIASKPSVKRQVLKYIREIRKLRNEGRTIWYHDETWVNANDCNDFVWVGDGGEIAPPGMTVNGVGKRTIISHVFGEQGLLDGAMLMFEGSQSKKKKTKKDKLQEKIDYHQDMNEHNFLGYMETQVLPKIKGDVLVIDRATYHMTVTDETKPPMSAFLKHDYIKYILKHQQTGPNQKTLQQLYDMTVLLELKPLAKSLAPTPILKIVELAKKFNVTVVVLPVAHPNLNLIEFLWARVKQHVCYNNTEFSLEKAKDLVREEFARVQSRDARSIMCQRVIKYEDQLLSVYAEFDDSDIMEEEVDLEEPEEDENLETD